MHPDGRLAAPPPRCPATRPAAPPPPSRSAERQPARWWEEKLATDRPERQPAAERDDLDIVCGWQPAWRSSGRLSRSAGRKRGCLAAGRQSGRKSVDSWQYCRPAGWHARRQAGCRASQPAVRPSTAGGAAGCQTAVPAVTREAHQAEGCPQVVDAVDSSAGHGPRPWRVLPLGTCPKPCPEAVTGPEALDSGTPEVPLQGAGRL